MQAQCLLCSTPKVTQALVSGHQPRFRPGQLLPSLLQHPSCPLQYWLGLSFGASFLPEANWTTAVGDMGPGNLRVGAAASAPCPQGTGPCLLWPVQPQQLLRCAGDNTISSKLVNAFPASRMHRVQRPPPCHDHHSPLRPRGAGHSWGQCCHAGPPHLGTREGLGSKIPAPAMIWFSACTSS